MRMKLLGSLTTTRRKSLLPWLFVGATVCFLGGRVLVTAQDCDALTGNCDTHERCPVWAAEGECKSSRYYMKEHCPGSCAIKKQDKSKIKDTTTSTAKNPTRVKLTFDKDKTSSCQDKLDRCSVWAELGQCDEDPEQMHEFCPQACGLCNDSAEDKCRDLHPKCEIFADVGECEKNPHWMEEHCTKACKKCGNKKANNEKESLAEPERVLEELSQDERDALLLEKSKEFGEFQTADGNDKERTLERIRTTILYMKSDTVQALPSKVLKGCKNQHELCTFWAVLGECDANKAYMATNCAPACMTCELLDFNNRCPPLPEGTPAALEPGGLDAMFTRIISTAPGNQTNISVSPEIPPYTVTVHSSPDDNGRPWVITLDNFFTEEEAKALIEHGYEEGYKRSEDVGKRKLDGSFSSVQSEGRTSENAWCSAHGGCRFKDVPKRILDRMAAVTGIPPENHEDMQILKYENGQFYNTHHDYIEHQKTRNCGPRILTFFLYLSDVEEGGGTDFPDLGITVMPKRGRALLWPSVTNDAPLNKDRRMEHQALPVEKGVKFAANAWIHMYDYVAPQSAGCN